MTVPEGKEAQCRVPDWWECLSAAHQGWFPLSREESWVVEAHLRGYPVSQCYAWLGGRTTYLRVVKELQRRWWPMEQMLQQWNFPPAPTQERRNPPWPLQWPPSAAKNMPTDGGSH